MRHTFYLLSKSLLITVIVCLLFGNAFAEKFGKVSDEEWAMVAPPDYPDANAIILFNNGEIDITRDIITYYKHVRVKVLNRAGVDEVGDWSIGYDKESSKLKNFKAHTITPDGKKHKVEDNAIFEKTYGDYVEKTFTFPMVDSGCILEYEYRIRSDYYRWLTPWYFQSDLFTLSSTLSAKLYPGFSYNFDFGNVPPQFREPEVENLANPEMTNGQMAPVKKYSWTITNLLPVPEEPYMSCVEDFRASIRFQLTGYSSPTFKYSYVKSWGELADEVNQIFNIYNNESGKLKKIAEELTANATTDHEKSGALYKYVTSSFANSYDYTNRYMCNEHMSDLFSGMRGSPEEKNFLLAAMHEAIGIHAYPVLISTRDHAEFNPRYPSLRWFNHLVAFVEFGQEWEFLDTRSVHVPYGLLPPDCLTDGGLLVGDSAVELVQITIKPVQSYRIDVTDMHLLSDRSAACTTSTEFGGYLASSYGRKYDQEKSDELLKDTYLSALDNDYFLESHTCELDTSGTFTANLQYNCKEVMRRVDDYAVIKPIQFMFRTNPFKSEKRHVPVDFAFPATYRNVVRIFGMMDIDPPVLPPDTTFSTSGLTFERTSTIEGDVVVITSTISIIQTLCPPGLYASLRGFFDAVASASEEEVAALAGTE